jgi:hypothetical protein
MLCARAGLTAPGGAPAEFSKNLGKQSLILAGLTAPGGAPAKSKDLGEKTLVSAGLTAL